MVAVATMPTPGVVTAGAKMAGVAAAPSFARQRALQARTIEQLFHMIHTMLAAILVALVWTSGAP